MNECGSIKKKLHTYPYITYFRPAENITEEKGWTAGLGSWCKFTCCPKPATSEESVKFEAILAKLDDMESKMHTLEDQVINLLQFA